MPTSQQDKADRFRALHQGTGAFVVANAWDAGSARVLAGLGFAALATSSGASAGVLGRRDGQVSRDEALAHCRAIVEGCDLPVSADLEKGWGDRPEDAAETIRLAAQVGLVGAPSKMRPAIPPSRSTTWRTRSSGSRRRRRRPAPCRFLFW